MLAAVFIMTLAYKSEAQDGYISPVTAYGEDLDLTAVMVVFKESYDLADFERRLNERNGINNLDLNDDGIVDYVRVTEKRLARSSDRVIFLQAILGDYQLQDIAVINVERRGARQVYVQCEGNIDIYGPNYFVEPPYSSYNYVHTWPIWRVMFRRHYRTYRSPWRWRYYPRYWRYRRPVLYDTYYSRTRTYYDRDGFIYTRSTYRPRYSYSYNRYSRFKNRPARKIHKYRSYSTYKHRSGNGDRNSRNNVYNDNNNNRRNDAHTRNNSRNNSNNRGTNTRNNTRRNTNNRGTNTRTNTRQTKDKGKTNTKNNTRKSGKRKDTNRTKTSRTR